MPECELSANKLESKDNTFISLENYIFWRLMF